MDKWKNPLSGETKQEKNRRLGNIKMFLQDKVKRTLNDDDILLLNEKESPDRLFAINGLYQKIKVNLRRSESNMMIRTQSAHKSYGSPKPSTRSKPATSRNSDL